MSAWMKEGEGKETGTLVALVDEQSTAVPKGLGVLNAVLSLFGNSP